MDNKINWIPPELPAEIPQGDMPGDRVKIYADAVEKANLLFPLLLKWREKFCRKKQKCVISVSGGSGVGKTSIASVLAYYFNHMEIGAYTLSGDNYPRRLPKYNDAERMHRFQEGGLLYMVRENCYTQENYEQLREFQRQGTDADTKLAEQIPWLQTYIAGGTAALENYLGTREEVEFDLINHVIQQFKDGKKELWLKRMGKEDGELWFEKKDFSDIEILILEWTHGNSDELKGIDFPIYLNSTPQETMEFRKARNRNKNADSPFVTRVLEIEQKKLYRQAHKAKIILSKEGKIMSKLNNRPMLNAYPDSMGGSLDKIVALLKSRELKDVFSSFYILPSLYHSDLDRGFSVIDYDLDEELAKREDLDALKDENIDIKLDFILNHASVQSPQFQDLLKNGENSEYKDFFIDWNKFWDGHGTMTEEGYIQPDKELIKNMFFRKPGLPILMVCFPDGKKVPYWNTFYQEVLDENHYRGQMDLNLKSPLVWDFYQKTLEKLSGYGATIVRLDAFAYAPKEVGKRNFLNEPDTWEVLEQIRSMADKEGMELLPEIHASYAEGVYKKIAKKGYLTYDFFLPGLILDAIENQRTVYLGKWAQELYSENIRTVNMLGCHDGIPLLDLEGLLEKEDIESLIHTLVDRGGYVKNLHGQKNVYYQVNTTYFSALGEDENKLLLARAIQMFMPGKPQIWYLDLFAGVNDYEAVKRAGAGGHKEINRTNLSVEEVKNALEKNVVKKQMELIRFRNTCEAFHPDAIIKTKAEGHTLTISWTYQGTQAVLDADLQSCTFDIKLNPVV